MNSEQNKILLMGGLIVALMVLFPPWVYFDNDSSRRSPAGYHFILTPPPLKSPLEMFGTPKIRFPTLLRVYVDWYRLIAQLLVTIPFVAGLVLLLAGHRSVAKTIIGVLLIGFALSILGFILWLEISTRLERSNSGGKPHQRLQRTRWESLSSLTPTR